MALTTISLGIVLTYLEGNAPWHLLALLALFLIGMLSITAVWPDPAPPKLTLHPKPNDKDDNSNSSILPFRN